MRDCGLESHYDAVETVKFMGWILLRADGGYKILCHSPDPRLGPLIVAGPPTLAEKRHTHKRTQTSRDEVRSSVSDHSAVLLDTY